MAGLPRHPRLSRRTLLGALTGAGAGALGAGLSGCGSSASISADPSELVFWFWSRLAVAPELLAEAGVSIPGSPEHRIRGDIIGGTFDTKLRTSLAGGAYVPDLTLINSNCALYFPAEEEFLDFNDLGGAQLVDRCYPWKVELGTTPSGRLCFWPYDTGPTGFYYRADLFEAAGLPTEPDQVSARIRTWDDWIELGTELAAGDGPAMVSNAGVVFSQFLNASAERYFDREDRPLFEVDGSAVREAWDTSVRAIEAGVTGNRQTSTDQTSAFVTGQTAGHLEAVWWMEVLATTAPDTQGLWRVAEQPVNPGNSGGSFVAIPRTCKNPEAAFAFATWLTTPENWIRAFNAIQLFPSTPAAFDGDIRSDSEFFGDQDMLGFFSAAAERVPTAYISTHESLVTAFTTELDNVEIGAKTSEQAWREAVDQVNRVLRKRGVIT